MALIVCGKCGEQVDEAKAFCPACGSPMVEERLRTEGSSFDKADMTMHLGQTMYSQMLSDMGLNISKAPDAEKGITIQPVSTLPPPKQDLSGAPAKASNRRIWIITIVVAAALLFAALIVIGVAGIMFYLSGSNTQ